MWGDGAVECRAGESGLFHVDIDVCVEVSDELYEVISCVRENMWA